MKSLKRLQISLSSKFENFVNEVENQAAVIDSIIDEIQQTLASTRIQVRTVERGLLNAQKRAEELLVEISIWEARAKESHSEDAQMAENCVRKVILLKEEKEQTTKNILSAEETLIRLRKESAQIEQKLREVKTKKHEIQSRESKVRLCSIEDKGRNLSLNDVFNRWENKIIEKESYFGEPLGEPQRTEDPVESFFEKKENDQKMQDELKRILGQ